jgi:integrase
MSSKTPQTLLDFCEWQFVTSRKPPVTPFTRRTQRTHCLRLNHFLGRDALVSDLNADTFRQFATWLDCDRFQHRTQLDSLGFLRNLWRKARAAGLVKEGPPERARKERPSRKKPRPPAIPGSLREFFEQQYAPARLQNVTAGSRRTRVCPFNRFSRYLGRQAMVTDLTPWHFAGFEAWLDAQSYCDETKGKSRMLLRAVWRHAHAIGAVETLPPKLRGRPGRKRPKAAPSRDDGQVQVNYVDSWVCSSEAFEVVDSPRGGIESFLDYYIRSRTDVKASTRMQLNLVKRRLVEFFGPNRQLGSIAPGDADEFRLYLSQTTRNNTLAETMADNTVRRTCGRAKQFFRAAVRKKLIDDNPFADMKNCQVRGNHAREFYVTREMAGRVLAACPNAEWRLLFALGRFGGLRCPSEYVRLRWEHIDWKGGRVRVTSPKTEHHEGKASRDLPLFPELREHLAESHKLAGRPKSGYVLARFGSAVTDRLEKNLGPEMAKIVRKAGMKPWPKLFQNLRSTRQTELTDSFPIHVVCAWLGNSEVIARKHYLQVTDDYFEKALGQIGGAA